MNLISLLVVLVVVGLVLYLVNRLPLEDWIKVVIKVVAILFVIVWLLQSLGIVGPTISLGG